MTHRKTQPTGVMVEEARDGRPVCLAARDRRDAECASCCLRDALTLPFNHSGLEGGLLEIGRVCLSADAVLYREGETGAYLYSLRSGLVKLVQHLPNGTCRIVRVLRKGDVAGLELLYRPGYRHMAVALGPVESCRIRASSMAQMERSHPRLHEELVGHWERDLEAADWWITHISTGSVGARLARLIRFLKQRDGANPAHLVSLPQQGDIAAMLGVATETVCRAIAHFQHDGLLRGIGDGLFEFDAATLNKRAED